MRVIVRKERPHPGAQLRFTDLDGHLFTAFATDARKGQLADLELRHRRRVRCEDRIRCAKDTGLRNLPLKGFAHNQLWCEIVALACELLAWTQLLALAGEARRGEPRRLRLCLFAVAGRLVRGGRRLRLRLAARWRWAARSPPRSSACRPSLPADQQNRHCDAEGATPRGPWNLRPPGATAGQPATARARKITTRRKDGPHVSHAKDRG
jgi:Transposase DDE domain group 1